ncbi:MAG: hypothetical protein WCJ09_06040 [Planctomycetota bacterium]
MQKHAMALGYFFLSVFCIFASSQGQLRFQIPLLLVALITALMGIGFLMIAWAAQFQTAKRWVLEMVRLARQELNDAK